MRKIELVCFQRLIKKKKMIYLDRFCGTQLRRVDAGGTTNQFTFHREKYMCFETIDNLESFNGI